MGTTESVLLEQHHEESQAPTIPTSPTKKHAPKRHAKLRLNDATSAGCSSLNQRILITYSGIILGLPSSGKRTLQKRLEGKNPFHEASYNDEDTPKEMKSKKSNGNQRIVIPYHAPGPTWGERIQLEVEMREDVPDNLDFGIIMLNPQHDPDQLKSYLLRTLSFLSKRRNTSICILLNFRDQQLKSNASQISEEDVKTWIQDGPITNLPGTAMFNGLRKTIVTSLKNCYGLASLHNFIYQSYLYQKQKHLEDQLKEVEKASQQINQSNRDMPYEDFVALLNQSSSIQSPTTISIPVESSRTPTSTQVDPIPRRKFHQNLKRNSQEKSMIFPSKRLGNVQTLEDFFADDDDMDNTWQSQAKGKSTSQTSDDDEDDYYYDDSGRRMTTANSNQQNVTVHDAQQQSSGRGTTSRSIHRGNKTETMETKIESSMLSEPNGTQITNPKMEYPNDEKSNVNKAAARKKDQDTKPIVNRFQNQADAGLPTKVTSHSVSSDPPHSPSIKTHLSEGIDINRDQGDNESITGVDTSTNYSTKITDEATSNIPDQGSEESIEQNGWESDDFDLESSEHTMISEGEQHEKRIDGTEEDCNIKLNNSDNEKDPDVIDKSRPKVVLKSFSEGAPSDASDSRPFTDQVHNDIVEENKDSLCRAALRDDAVSASDISSSSLIETKEIQVNEVDQVSPSMNEENENREKVYESKDLSRHPQHSFLGKKAMVIEDEDDDDDYMIQSTPQDPLMSLEKEDNDDEYMIEDSSFPMSLDTSMKQSSEDIQYQNQEVMEENIEPTSFQDKSLSSEILAAIQEAEKQAKLMLESESTSEPRDDSARKVKKAKKQKNEKKSTKKKSKKSQAL
jgi:hypothetical protein